MCLGMFSLLVLQDGKESPRDRVNLLRHRVASQLRGSGDTQEI